MIYLKKSNRFRPNKKTLTIIGIILVIGFIVLTQRFFGRQLSVLVLKTGVTFSSPIQSAKQKLSLLHSLILSKKDLLNDNKKLQDEIDKMKVDLLAYNVLTQEHNLLLAAYNRSEIPKKVLASVVIKPPQSPYDSLVLDIGSEKGIAPGNRVFSFGNIVIGRVVEIGKSVSRVELFSYPNKETESANVRTGETVKLIGRGGGNFEAQVDQDFDIQNDDTLVLSGLQSPILAVVAEVEDNPASAYKQVLIRTPINIFNLRFVEVEITPEII